MNVTGLH